MAGVGDKIDADLLCGDRRRTVDHAHEGSTVAEVPNHHAPRPADFPDPSHVNVTRAAGEDVLQRVGMADRQAHVTTFDAASEDRFRLLVGEADGKPFDNECGLVERVY